MRAVILAGGRGTRLAPYTTTIPKPLVPLGDTAILEIVLRQLAHSGFDHVTLTLGHMGAYVRAFVEQHRSLGRLVKIDYSEEETPSGTAGAVGRVPGLRDTFLVMNGDVLTDLDYRDLVRFHKAGKALLTIAAHRKAVKIDLGVMVTDGAGRVTDYIEKPTTDYTVSMGIYVYEPAVLAHLPAGEYFDFPDLVLRLVRAGERVAAYRNDAYWLDLGRAEDLQQATGHFLNNEAAFLPPGKER
jgi:NDP-sugar pyrophosphorylase family protein